MISIIKAKAEDYRLLADIGSTSFMESHGSSAEPSEINSYITEKYSYNVFKEEIRDPNNIYHIMYSDNKPAGYSNVIFSVPHSNIQIENVTKLDRIYLLKEFYGLGMGYELFRFNLELSKKYNQAGMWLYVWKENHRAVSFYLKTGFKIIGSYDFRLSKTHSNPNHQMFMLF